MGYTPPKKPATFPNHRVPREDVLGFYASSTDPAVGCCNLCIPNDCVCGELDFLDDDIEYCDDDDCPCIGTGEAEDLAVCIHHVENYDDVDATPVETWYELYGNNPQNEDKDDAEENTDIPDEDE